MADLLEGLRLRIQEAAQGSVLRVGAGFPLHFLHPGQNRSVQIPVFVVPPGYTLLLNDIQPPRKNYIHVKVAEIADVNGQELGSISANGVSIEATPGRAYFVHESRMPLDFLAELKSAGRLRKTH